MIWAHLSLPYISKLYLLKWVLPSCCFHLVSTDQEMIDISVHKVSEGQMHEGWGPTLLACLDLADKSLLTILFLWKKPVWGMGFSVIMFPGRGAGKI